MKRAKQLGSVVFEYNTLFIREEFENDSILSEVYMSAARSHIVFEAEIATPYITLESHNNGWITEAQRAALVTMWKQLDTTFTLTYNDNSTETVRFAREKKMQFTPLYEGAKKYTAVIPLAKI
jgi:hypothetical protein